ncbi:unnamed protein product [Ceratitis capitata]|uniref:(Mediterranean fruit fly) hypothetical protein n=1 Tax=Ceratitis capitata TaxID=7213 RepID=A0A811V4K9_CERCA|nr:unnamed protein product [Ceratitis capitata]
MYIPLVVVVNEGATTNSSAPSTSLLLSASHYALQQRDNHDYVETPRPSRTKSFYANFIGFLLLAFSSFSRFSATFISCSFNTLLKFTLLPHQRCWLAVFFSLGLLFPTLQSTLVLSAAVCSMCMYVCVCGVCV